MPRPRKSIERLDRMALISRPPLGCAPIRVAITAGGRSLPRRESLRKHSEKWQYRRSDQGS